MQNQRLKQQQQQALMQQALLQQQSLYHPGLLAPPQVRLLLFFFWVVYSILWWYECILLSDLYLFGNRGGYSRFLGFGLYCVWFIWKYWAWRYCFSSVNLFVLLVGFEMNAFVWQHFNSNFTPDMIFWNFWHFWIYDLKVYLFFLFFLTLCWVLIGQTKLEQRECVFLRIVSTRSWSFFFFYLLDLLCCLVEMLCLDVYWWVWLISVVFI